MACQADRTDRTVNAEKLVFLPNPLGLLKRAIRMARPFSAKQRLLVGVSGRVSAFGPHLQPVLETDWPALEGDGRTWCGKKWH